MNPHATAPIALGLLGLVAVGSPLGAIAAEESSPLRISDVRPTRRGLEATVSARGDAECKDCVLRLSVYGKGLNAKPTAATTSDPFSLEPGGRTKVQIESRGLDNTSFRLTVLHGAGEVLAAWTRKLEPPPPPPEPDLELGSPTILQGSRKVAVQLVNVGEGVAQDCRLWLRILEVKGTPTSSGQFARSKDLGTIERGETMQKIEAPDGLGVDLRDTGFEMITECRGHKSNTIRHP